MRIDLGNVVSSKAGSQAFVVYSVLACLLLATVPSGAADHGDTPLLRALQRHDARITDLFAFIRNENLVIAVGLNPAIPPEATTYTFPPSLNVKINIDRDSPVSFDDPDDLRLYGGTILEPERIREDLVFEIEFDRRSRPNLKISGMPGKMIKETRLFTGLRDDPFIRGPRQGRNVAAVVIELPAEEVVEAHGTLLIWATTKVPEIQGPMADMAGRALRSMFPENDWMNTSHPSQHTATSGEPPDVMIFDTSRHAAYPNGRALTDDVVDLVGDGRILQNDAPFPDENDVPLLDEFPYLPPPQKQ